MSDTGHRKINQYEWADNATAAAGKGAPPPLPTVIPGQVKEFYGGALACGEKRALIIGGYDPKQQRSMRQVVEWTLSTRQWSRQTDLPERISRATAVAFEDYCFVWGGWDDAKFSNQLWLLVPSATTCQKPLLPRATLQPSLARRCDLLSISSLWLNFVPFITSLSII